MPSLVSDLVYEIYISKNESFSEKNSLINKDEENRCIRTVTELHGLRLYRSVDNEKNKITGIFSLIGAESFTVIGHNNSC